MLLGPAPAGATQEVPPLTGRVVDLAGALPPERRAALEARLEAFERETSHQIAVLVVPTLGGEPIEDFSLRVAETWALGHEGLDNGVLLVVAPEDRAARIEVGYGLEGVIPDAIAKRILEDVMFPHFRAGRLADGIEAGVEAIMQAARGEEIPAARRPAARAPQGDVFSLIFFTSIFGSFLAAPFARARKRALGALVAGAGSTLIAWWLGVAWPWLAAAFVLGALLGLGMTGARSGRGGRLGHYGGFGGGFGGGGFSGGGGGFGGGGASGRW